MDPRAFVAALDDDRIVAKIRDAEARSRGEIRVHVTSAAVADARAAAEEAFVKLGMAQTVERTGVLVFMAPASQSLAIIGDQAIDACCPEGFWAALVDLARAEFRQGRYTEGIALVVERIGEEMARHFPLRKGVADRDELPNAVSRD